MNKVSHFEIPADDTQKISDFYQKAFGWRVHDVPNMNYAMLYTTQVDENNMTKETNAINGGLFERGDSGFTAPTLVITVKSIDDTLENVQQNGGSVVKEKITVGDFGFVAYFKDPEGNVLGVWENAN